MSTPANATAPIAASVQGTTVSAAGMGAPLGAGVRADAPFGFTTGGRWVSTCAAYSRTMTVPGGTVPTAAVTFVTVSPSYRRRGLLTQMMRHQLEDVVRRGLRTRRRSR